MRGNGPGRREVRRFTYARRARYLEVLGLTGNRTAAAGAIGFYTERLGRMRKRDAAFAEACAEAEAAATRRLSGAKGPFEGVDDGEFHTIRRGRGGKAQIIAVGPGRWSKPVEERFIAVLSLCGNVEASARAVGFAGTDMFRRRRGWPDFARRWEEALDEAETRLEFRLACIGNDAGAPARRKEAPSATAGRRRTCPPPTPPLKGGEKLRSIPNSRSNS